MNNKILYVTLAVSASVAFTFTLLLYYWLARRNPLPRLSYGIFVSVLPALGTFVLLKFTKLSVSWKGVVLIYVLLFILVFIQFLVRTYLG